MKMVDNEVEKQKNYTLALERVLRELVHLNCCEEEGISVGMPSAERWEEAFRNANKILRRGC